MSLIYCPECNKEISDQSKRCIHCGYKIKRKLSPEKKKKMKIVGVALSLIAIILVFLGYLFFSPSTVTWCCIHDMSVPTCTTGSVCIRCGKTEDNIMNHDWEVATCSTPKTCKVCGIVEGDALGHTWNEATCTEPMTCMFCGERRGECKGHSWKDATCSEPKQCKICNMIVGDVIDHYWTAATCNTPKTCKMCRKTQGQKLSHQYTSATCTEAKKCKLCGEKNGKSLGHNYVEYICTRCKKTNVTAADVPKILDISSLKWDMNSVGGIDQNMIFTNKSSKKTINYIYLEMQFYNAVGDLIKNDIGNRDSVMLQYTGPLGPGKKSERAYWDACFYNSSFKGTISFKSIEIVYSDGTSLVLDSFISNNAVVDWR